MKKKRGFTWAGGLLLGSSAAMLSVLPAATAVSAPMLVGNWAYLGQPSPPPLAPNFSPCALINLAGSGLPTDANNCIVRQLPPSPQAALLPIPPASSECRLKPGWNECLRQVVLNNPNPFRRADGRSIPLSDSTGAVGTSRYVQFVNSRFGIYSRGSTTPLAQGTLANFTVNGNPGGAGAVGGKLYSPQIIWDPTSNRFYYAMSAIVGPNDNRLLYGYSKTTAPTTAADWCNYETSYGTELPDFPMLGDTQYFFVIGVNVYQSNGVQANPVTPRPTVDPAPFVQTPFLRSEALAFGKPRAGFACDGAPQLGKKTLDAGVRPDGTPIHVFTPVPANQIDTAIDGYIVARAGTLPIPANSTDPAGDAASDRLWTYRVTRNPDGTAGIQQQGSPLVVPSYSVPLPATQRPELFAQQPAVVTQRIDTGDARLTQVMMARNPLRNGAFVLWTQHTVLAQKAYDPITKKVTGVSGIRWYEINPRQSVFPFNPAVLATGLVEAPDVFLYNAAISPDRKFDGVTASAFGDSLVLTYTMSSAKANLWPQIAMSSSVKGGAFSAPVVVRTAVGPYRDFSCPKRDNICPWGNYAGAAPDPRPSTFGTGAVWLTNQYAGFVTPGTVLPPTNQSNWRTWIWAAQP